MVKLTRILRPTPTLGSLLKYHDELLELLQVSESTREVITATPAPQEKDMQIEEKKEFVHYVPMLIAILFSVLMMIAIVAFKYKCSKKRSREEASCEDLTIVRKTSKEDSCDMFDLV